MIIVVRIPARRFRNYRSEHTFPAIANESKDAIIKIDSIDAASKRILSAIRAKSSILPL